MVNNLSHALSGDTIFLASDFQGGTVESVPAESARGSSSGSPIAADTQQRVQFVLNNHQLAEAGIPTAVLLAPVIPGITDDAPRSYQRHVQEVVAALKRRIGLNGSGHSIGKEDPADTRSASTQVQLF